MWIEINAKRIDGGRYTSKNDAARKYNELAIKYFGEFARLNIIDENKEEVLEYKTPKSRIKVD